MFTTTALTENFGARVDNIDLRTLPDADTMRRLASILFENRLLLIKRQDLSIDEYYRFGQQWGTLIAHILDFLRVPGYPEMMAIGNTEQKDQDPKIRNGAAHWHTDGSYKIPPTAITMLYARKAPRVGGATWFADMARAYDALDTDRQRVAQNSIANHFFGAGVADDEMPVAPFSDPTQPDAVPSVKNSLVKIHPVTGRKALYGLGQSPYSIDGLSDTESAALLAELKAHATSAEFLYEHHYEVGDIMLIDCLATMHKGTKTEFADIDDVDHARLLWRLSTEGLPAALAS